MGISLLEGFFKGYNKDKDREAEQEMLKEQMKLQSQIDQTKRFQSLEDQLFLYENKQKIDQMMGKGNTSFQAPIGDENNPRIVSFPKKETFDKNLDQEEKKTAILKIASQLETDEDLKTFTKYAVGNGYGDDFLSFANTVLSQSAKGKYQNGIFTPALPLIHDIKETSPMYSIVSSYAQKRLGLNPQELKQGNFNLYSWNIGTEEKPAYAVSAEPPYELDMQDLAVDEIKFETFKYNNAMDLLDRRKPTTSVINSEGRHIRTGEFDSVDDLRLRDAYTYDANIQANVPIFTKAFMPYFTDVKEQDIAGTLTGVEFGLQKGKLSNDIYSSILNSRYTGIGDPKLIDDKELNVNNENYQTQMTKLRQLRDLEGQMFSIFEILLTVEGGIDELSNAGNAQTFLKNILGEGGQLEQFIAIGRGFFNNNVDGDIFRDFSNSNKAQVANAFNSISDKSVDATERLRAMYTILAYNVALQIQGGVSLSARISNQDFEQALNSVQGSRSTKANTRVGILLDFLDRGIEKRVTLELLENEDGFLFEKAYDKTLPIATKLIDRKLAGQTDDQLAFKLKNPARLISAYYMIDDNKGDQMVRIVNMAYKDNTEAFYTEDVASEEEQSDRGF